MANVTKMGFPVEGWLVDNGKNLVLKCNAIPYDEWPFKNAANLLASI